MCVLCVWLCVFVVCVCVSAVGDMECAFVEAFVHVVGHVEGADDVVSALHKIRWDVSYFAHVFFKD